MKTYGHLPLYLCVVVLILLSVYLALYVAVFSALLVKICLKPGACLFAVPVFWVSLEYLKSFLFSGFPWELLGYSQFNNLHLIQIADIFGVYGISFFIALSNASILLVFLCLTGKNWQKSKVNKRLPAGSAIAFILIFGFIWYYGKWKIESVDKLISNSPSAKITIIQGNIGQDKKWDTAFQRVVTKKYIELSLSSKKDRPDLVVWPETATPFYFLYNTEMTEIVQNGISGTDADYLIGSPSFVPENKIIKFYNSAYLIGHDKKVYGKYDKVHLVPFGEYIPFGKWLPFFGKIVAGIGDFSVGCKGKTVNWGDYKLGVQICYEIIFPNLSRAMTYNKAALLINITNDAWFGRTCAPYQHFSMAIFRAIENRRSLIRSANTGISGFIDPVGRVIGQTDIFKATVMTRSMPIIVGSTTFYTRFGDLFAAACLIAAFFMLIIYKKKEIKNVFRTKTKSKRT